MYMYNFLIFYIVKQEQAEIIQLAVSKGPVVILLKILTKNGRLLQRPTHKLVRGIHCQGITGQACTTQGVVYTCGVRGTIQKFTAGKNPFS